VPQLSSPCDDSTEADSSLNTETANQYVWVSVLLATLNCRNNHSRLWCNYNECTPIVRNKNPQMCYSRLVEQMSFQLFSER